MSSPIPAQHRPALEHALATLREIFPDTPLMLVVGFTGEDHTSICTASNLSAQHQFELMSCALEGFAPAPQGAISH